MQAKRIAAIMALTAASAGATLVSATVSYATQRPAAPTRFVTVRATQPGISAQVACSSLCGWTRTYFRGTTWKTHGQSGTCYTFGNFELRSSENHTGHTVRYYARSNCRGSYFDLRTKHYSAATPFKVRSVWVR